MQVERVGAGRFQRRQDDGKILGAAPCHDGVDGHFLDGGGFEIRGDHRDDIRRRPGRAFEHAEHPVFGRWHHREAVGQPLSSQELEGVISYRDPNASPGELLRAPLDPPIDGRHQGRGRGTRILVAILAAGSWQRRAPRYPHPSRHTSRSPGSRLCSSQLCPIPRSCPRPDRQVSSAPARARRRTRTGPETSRSVSSTIGVVRLAASTNPPVSATSLCDTATVRSPCDPSVRCSCSTRGATSEHVAQSCLTKNRSVADSEDSPGNASRRSSGPASSKGGAEFPGVGRVDTWLLWQGQGDQGRHPRSANRHGYVLPTSEHIRHR